MLVGSDADHSVGRAEAVEKHRDTQHYTAEEEFVQFREELRDAVRNFRAFEDGGAFENGGGSTSSRSPLNIHVVGPQGSGKTR